MADFMDLPVKRYSSGMYVRLAFSVAAHLTSDVLLIDEVLAVGDEGFRDKCLDRMNAEAASGRTLIFVSHDTAAMKLFTDRVIHLEQGRILVDGNCDEGIASYEEACALRAAASASS